MPIGDLSSREAVLQAIAEFDELGEDEFLQRYGYRRALRWLLRFEGKEYPSKAIAGVAYSKQYPDRVSLRETGQITGGEHSVVRKLRELGFEVERLRAEVPAGARVWIVRAGREGRYEQLALEEGVAVIGWSEIGPLTPPVTRDELKALVREASDDEQKEQSINVQAGQIYRFIEEIALGDLIVLPHLANPGHVAVGRVEGEYEFLETGPFEDADAKHTRPTEWLAEAVPYENFPDDLRSAFGQQGTVSEIGKPNAAARILAALAGPAEAVVHLLQRWAPAQEPRTIEMHRDVEANNGAVWWGKLGNPAGKAAIAAKRLAILREQLADGVATYVFLHRTGEVWRTRLVDIRTERPDEEAELIPAYYRGATDEHHLWLKLEDFEQLPPDFAETALVLDGSDDPESIVKAFKGQQSLLYVRETGEHRDRRSSRAWWVNQGSSYARSQAGGYLWAPKLTKDGQQRADWDSLSLARAGDIVLNYAKGVVRAVSTVESEAVDAPRPAPEDEASWNMDGRRLSVRYRELESPIRLAEIPSDWRVEESGPFDKDGGVKQGYFYRLSDAFVARMAQRFPILELDSSRPPPERLTIAAVKESAEGEPYRLRLDDTLYATVVAALESGKHIILTGPPGTAKTTLAQAVADTAKRLGLCDGYLLTTATADWTTYETIGGLRPRGANQLEFEPGHFLKAIAARQWLVIDELNRSQFDRAFGQLFTVLSGQAVTLPYTRPGANAPLTLLPEGAATPSGASDVLEIPREWRIVATMNVFDKSLLFEMSYALMRRFAFIEVPSPNDSTFEELIDLWAEESDEAAEAAKALLQVRKVKDIGPAVYRDIARFAAQRLRLGDVDPKELRYQAFYSYLLPQFEGVTDEQGIQLLKVVANAVGSSKREEIRTTLNNVLGLELEAPSSHDGDLDGEDLDAIEAVEQLEELQ